MQNNMCRIFLILIFLTACAQNKPYRIGGIVEGCYEPLSACDEAIIEKHFEFDLAYIEFTERGNLYHRQRTAAVMKFINEQARSPNGAAVFVFVHGWKHNADPNDSNVLQFKDMLSRAAENPFVGKRKVIGVFLGWRGEVTSMPLVRELSYWGRKSVAEEIGSGGATEIFSELNQILVRQFNGQKGDQDGLYKNTFVIIGHSFGGAIVLSGMHDLMLNNLIEAYYSKNLSSSEYCAKIERFADGIVLINPAIEANKIILLREASARCKFDKDQPQLMHVISSDADLATSRYFPIGQMANVTATSGPKKLRRRINDKNIELKEFDLDINTAGNLRQLRTGYLYYDKKAEEWAYQSCRLNPEACGLLTQSSRQNHIPVRENDPISFIKTGANFIKNHNDAFSCYVQAYITTIMFETQSVDKGYATVDNPRAEAKQGGSQTVASCDYRAFDFGRCFNNQLDEYDCELQ